MITSRWFCSLLLLGLAGCARAPQDTIAPEVSPESILLGKAPAGARAPAPRGGDGRPNFTGYWKLLRDENKPDGNLGKDEPGFALPYSEAGKAALEHNVNHTIDPEARCLITGIPRLLTGVLPFEILHTPQRLATFFMLGWHRWTWLDGRTAEPDPDPRYLGSAIGHWDGDTLVIESTGFKDSADGQLWLDDNGNPQSARSAVVERWTRPDLHHLDLVLTYTDPAYYTRPVRYERHWTLAAPGESLEEFSCEWNTPWVLAHLAPGPGPIGPDGNRGFGPNGQIVPDLPLGSVDDARGTGYWLYRKNKPKPSDPPAITPATRP